MLSTVPEWAVWAIFALPIVSLLLITFMSRDQAKYAGHVAALFIGAAFLLALWVLDSSLQEDGARILFSSHELLSVGELRVDVAVNIDGLSALMLVVVTVRVVPGADLLAGLHEAGDGGYWRYFAYMSLFTASMLGLLLFDSLLLVYVFWEMVGLSSYLLIGFWFHRPAAAAAAKKAFLVTRLGDLGFLGAILLIYVKAGTFNIPAIHDLALTGALGASTLTWFALGIFAGAAGKSAQVPLHVWLPDAMEGPTPVSALIHAATMVAAGVYLVARMFPVFNVSPTRCTSSGLIGGITAISAALIGLVMTDIKRVLAYSTISQLGYMMLALGVGAYVAAIFHLFTHAFFKALLFLGSGTVNHATNTFDMRLMGGLRKSMPITFVTFVIGSLSLAGFFPLAGFWSKDEILSVAWDHEKYLFYIALITAGLTAFYMFRAIFMTFFGEYKGGEPAEDDRRGPRSARPRRHTRPRRQRPRLARPARVALGHGAAAAHPRGAGDLRRLRQHQQGRRGPAARCAAQGRRGQRGALPVEHRHRCDPAAAGRRLPRLGDLPGEAGLVRVAAAALRAAAHAAREQVLPRRALRARHRADAVLRRHRRRAGDLRPRGRRWRRQRRRRRAHGRPATCCATYRPGSFRPTAPSRSPG